MLQKDMMSFGYLGNGGLSSAASNLSPLAPPFTVDRANPKFDLNPIGNFSEPNAFGVPFSSFHNWQYPRSSASGPEYYSNYESEIGSLHTADYSYLGSEPINPPTAHWAPPNPNTTDPTNNPFSYSGAPKQYYPPYQVLDNNVSSVGHGEANYELLSSSGLVPVVGSSQVDYTQGLSSLEFAPPWGGYWNGLSEGNCGRRTDIDGSFHFEETDFPGPHVYRDYLKQEVVPDEFLRCEVNSTATQRMYADVPEKEKNGGSLAKNQLDDCLHQNLRFSPTESSKGPIIGTSTKITESNLESPILEPVTFSSNLHQSNSLGGKGLQLFDSCIDDCTSVTKASVVPVIRPPIFGTSFPMQDTVASKSINIGDTAAVNKKDVGSYNQTIEKEPLLPSNSEVKEGFLDSNHLCFQASRNDQRICSPASSLAKPLSKNSLNHGIKIRGQIPDINVPHCSSMSVDNPEAIKHTASATENSDNYNPAEDSPCWKGAPASNVSPFKSLEAIPGQNRSKKLETRGLLDFEAVHKFPHNEFVMDFSSQVCGHNLRKENLSTNNTKAVLPMKNLIATSPTKELLAAADCRSKSDGVQQNENNRDQYSSNVESPIEQYNLLNTSKSDSGSLQIPIKQLFPKEVNITSNSAVDAGIITSENLEDGCIPLHYVENVLYSPPSEEGKAPATDSSEKVNVQTLASALHNISELLILNSFDDKWELKERDSKTLQHAVSNISLCLSKKIVQLTPKQEPIFSTAGISHILKESATKARLHATDEVGNTAVDQLDSYSTHEKKRICGVSDKNIEKLMNVVSLKNDADITRHHNVVQNIKTVLDENFQSEESMTSETLLYRNLWLNAEAELCVTGLKSRFNKVKIQLEDCKSYKTKENSVVLKKIPSTNVCNDPPLDVASGSTPEANDILKQKASVPCIPSTKSDVKDDEASVMARFQILKCRDDNINNTSNLEVKSLPDVVQPVDTDVGVEDSVMARFQILKCRGDKTRNLEEKSLLDEVQPDDTDVEDSVMAGFQILKCQGDNVNASNVEEKSLPDVVQPDDTDFGVPWQITGSQTGKKSFDVAVGSRVHRHSDHGKTENVGLSPHDPQHEAVKEFSVYAPDDSTTVQSRGPVWIQNIPSEWVNSTIAQPRGKISMHNGLASGPGWNKETPSDWDGPTTAQPISMHIMPAPGSGWNKNTPLDWDGFTAAQRISMHNELASGTGWNKNTAANGDGSTTAQPMSMHNELASGLGGYKNTASDWDGSTTAQTISMHNELAPGPGWNKNTPSDWGGSSTARPISMHNEHASGSGWYDNTPLDWEHVLKDDYEWHK
ncbi:hypothetical protein ACET3Z_009113 [Daucus carota]